MIFYKPITLITEVSLEIRSHFIDVKIHHSAVTVRKRLSLLEKQCNILTWLLCIALEWVKFPKWATTSEGTETWRWWTGENIEKVYNAYASHTRAHNIHAHTCAAYKLLHSSLYTSVTKIGERMEN